MLCWPYTISLVSVDPEMGNPLNLRADAPRDRSQEVPIRQFLLGNLARNSDGVQKFRVPLGILAKSLDNLGDFPFKDPNQARFVKPALFVRGTKSRYVPDEAIPIIGQFFPRFQMVDIDAGHWVTSEKPQEFLNGTCSSTPRSSVIQTQLLTEIV